VRLAEDCGDGQTVAWFAARGSRLAARGSRSSGGSGGSHIFSSCSLIAAGSS
jgi:hypothetical protein